MSQGFFLTLEGSEGSGKSTQAERLRARLEAKGFSVILTREPGGTPTGEKIREILQHNAAGEDILPLTEVLLFAACRAQLVEKVIRPALARGTIVLCDRFVDSSLAYQGFGRRMGLDRVLPVNESALAGCWPDLTLWFDLPVEVAFRRVARRGGREDRFEAENLEFHRRVSDGYRALAEHFPARFRRIAADRNIAEVEAEVWALVEERL